MSSRKVLTFVTDNAENLAEIKVILGTNFPLEITSVKLDLPEYQGKIEEISINKCQEAAKHVRGSVVVEYTSLCFNAMERFPGQNINRFLDKYGPVGMYHISEGWNDKRAEAVCTFAFSEGANSAVKLFQGRKQGTIVFPRGPTDIGWDPLFQPSGFDKTYAELPKEEKNKIRVQALVQLRDHFLKQT